MIESFEKEGHISNLALLDYLAREQNTIISTLRLNEKNRRKALTKIPIIKHNYSLQEIISAYECLTNF